MVKFGQLNAQRAYVAQIELGEIALRRGLDVVLQHPHLVSARFFSLLETILLWFC